MLLPLAVLVFVGLHGASAQITSNATCLSNWQSLYNSKGQSPCLVGAYLGGACNGGQYDVSELVDGQHYIGPTSSLANDCLCSTVMYSVMGACSTCQNATIITWSSWAATCPNVFVDIFPEDIPPETAVPGWAYENVTTSGTFSASQALSDNSPESTATLSQTTLTGTKSSSSATGTASSGVSGGSNSGNSKSSSNTGAIAGGVVAGVVGAALLALLAFFLLRRHRNKNAARVAAADADLAGSTYGGGMAHKDDYTPVPYTPHAYEGAGALGSPPMAQQKLYDPNDPSTFPTTPIPGSLNNQLTGQTYTANYPPPGAQMPSAPAQGSNQGMYRGVAEV